MTAVSGKFKNNLEVQWLILRSVPLQMTIEFLLHLSILQKQKKILLFTRLLTEAAKRVGTDCESSNLTLTPSAAK